MMTNTAKPGIITLLFIILLIAMPSWAAPPAVLSYQGQIYDSQGKPVTGTVDMAFALYAAAEGGAALWGEAHQGVKVSGGLFSVALGSMKPLDLDFDQPYWLGISVGNDEEMIPRTPLNSAPYARRAANIDQAAGVDLPADGPFANVITVAKSGGQFTSIQAALDSITDASASNPYLVWVGPGVYNEAVKTKDYVSVHGSGRGTTIITTPVGTATAWETGDHCRIRDFTLINNQASMGTVVGILLPASYTLLVNQVDLVMTEEGCQLKTGILCNAASNLRLSAVSITMNADATVGRTAGIYTTNTKIDATQATIKISGGDRVYAIAYRVLTTDQDWKATFYNSYFFVSGAANFNRVLNLANYSIEAGATCVAEIRNSSLIAENGTVVASNSGCEALIANSVIKGDSMGGGTRRCTDCYTIDLRGRIGSYCDQW